MPVPYKVTFDDDGNKCPRNIIELREKPECGVIFREEQPFKPNNRFPLPKGFELRHISKIPEKINIPQGIMPSTVMPMKEDPRRLAFTENEMPQDENQVNISRRINPYRTGYERIPGIPETELPNVLENIPEISRTFTHQDVDRVIQSLDDTMPTMVRDMIITDPLEEPVLEQPRSIIRQSRIRPLGDPRNTEFTEKLRPRGMSVAELIEDHIQQLKRTMPPDTHENVTKVVEQELFPLTPVSEEMAILKSIDKYVRKGRNEISQRELNEIIQDLTGRNITTEKIMEVVDKYNAFDPAFEKAVGGIADSQERAFLRRIKAVRTMIQEEPTLLTAKEQVSYGTFEDTNLIPKDVPPPSGSGTDTPLTEGDITRSRRFTLSQEASYYARRAKNLLPSQDYADPMFDIAEDITFERVKATEAQTELGKRLQLEALGVREKMVKAGKRLFAQEYAPVSLKEPVSFEMSDIGAMNLRIPETNTNIQGLRDIPLDPFSDTISSRKLTKLSFAERISAPRLTDVATGGAGAVGGLAVGFGVSQLLDQAKVNKYLNATLSGASADVGGRIITYGAERAALSAGFRTAEVAALTGSTLLRGMAEGGAIGLVTMPIDMMLNSSLRNAGLSHTASNMISSGVVGGGTIAAIWATGGSGAVETGGASLIVSAMAVGALELIAFLTGQSADREIDKHNSINNTRAEFIKTLPDYDYNYIEALNHFKDIDGLGRKEKDWASWSNNLNNVFSKYPKENETGSSSKLTIPKDVKNEIARLEATGRRVDARRAKGLRNQITEQPDESGLSVDDKLTMQKYFQKYMIHNIIKKVCSGKECSSELISQDTGELTDEEVGFLNSKTDRAWQSQADMQVEYSIVEMNYTQKRVQEAKQTLIMNWEKNRRLPEQLDDKNILKIANLDPNFKSAFDNAVKLDAQREVVNAYMTNQTKMENLPENIQKAANYDKEFYYMIHVYYRDIEHTAGKMNLSVPQLIQLQGLPENKQNEMYRKFQFDYAKMDDKTVGEAIAISKEEDAVREAGYYDIDQAYLNTDPTAVGIWKPTDSQILQAHSAGMTLQMYVNYMHELSKGKTGDFSKLPDYNPEDIKASGILDFSHFQDELQMGGYDKNMYIYNPDTLSITLNPNVSNVPIPSTQNHFVSKYTPENVLRSRQETADLLHGLDEQNQNIVDTYNTQLREQLSVFGKNYNKQVASINDNRSYHGINNLLVFDENLAYEKHHLEFQPATISSDVPVHTGDEATQRQLAEQPETGTIPNVRDTQNEVPNRIKDPEGVGGDYVGTPVPTITDNRPYRDTSYKPGDEPSWDDLLSGN